MEKKLFIFLNLILSASIIWLHVVVPIILKILFVFVEITESLLKFLSISYSNELIDAIFMDVTFFTFFGLYFFLIIFRIVIFPFLYKFKEKLPYIHNFFEKFRAEPQFRNKTLYLALLCDLLFYVFSIPIIKIENTLLSTDYSWSEIINYQSLIFLLVGGGVLISYASFFLWFDFNKKKFKKS